MRWTHLTFLSVAVTAAALGQSTPTLSRAEVLLEPHNGQTQFLLGDVIQLDLVFRDPAFPHALPEPAHSSRLSMQPGQTVLNSSLYGDLADTVTITPVTGWFQWRGPSGHDYSTVTPLDAAGITIPLAINQGYVFRQPGHYDISVVTHRLRDQPITTNTIGIDIAARPPEEEAELVRSLDSAIASGAQSRRAAEQLAYLTGDDAVHAKVKWLLGQNRNISEIMVDGMAATANQQLQLQLLKTAWIDPTRAPDNTLQFALKRAERFARRQTEPCWTMIVVPKHDAIDEDLAAEYSDDLDRVIATLPQRTGNVRRDTAYYLVQDNTLSSDQLAKVRPVVIDEFSRMDTMAQSMLIETRWNDIKDASLTPALMALIDSNAQLADHATALQRLVEIDERESTPYVIRMVCSPRRGLLLDKLNGVKQDRLPEVDSCLADILGAGERRPHDFDWEQAAQRAARFATPAILPAVKSAWKYPSQDASVLSILIRDAPKEAVELLDRNPQIDWYPTDKVYEALHGTFPAEILTWLRSAKAPESTASYQLAKFGMPTDRALLENRLHELRKQWLGREAEWNDAPVNSPAYQAKSEEMQLVSSLFAANAWKLTDEEKSRITDGCIGDWCRRYRPKPPHSNIQN